MCQKHSIRNVRSQLQWSDEISIIIIHYRIGRKDCYMILSAIISDS